MVGGVSSRVTSALSRPQWLKLNTPHERIHPDMAPLIEEQPLMISSIQRKVATEERVKTLSSLLGMNAGGRIGGGSLADGERRGDELTSEFGLLPQNESSAFRGGQ